MTVQAGLCWTRSETQIVGFLMRRLILSLTIHTYYLTVSWFKLEVHNDVEWFSVFGLTDNFPCMCLIILDETVKWSSEQLKKVEKSLQKNDLHHDKRNILHYAKTKAQISFAVTAKLISAFVSAIQIVHFLYFLHQNFQVSSLLLHLYSLVYVRPVRKPHCWFSHDGVADMLMLILVLMYHLLLKYYPD